MGAGGFRQTRRGVPKKYKTKKALHLYYDYGLRRPKMGLGEIYEAKCRGLGVMKTKKSGVGEGHKAKM